MTKKGFGRFSRKPLMWRWFSRAAVLAVAVGASVPAIADDGNPYQAGPSGNPQWSDDAAAAAQQTPIVPFLNASQPQATIPVYQTIFNAAGASATYQPGGPTTTSTNAFFQSLGSNGRSCASCHSPTAGWSVTPPQIQALFLRTGGQDPLFQPIDGTNCPTADISSWQARWNASSLLLNKGLIRVFEKLAAPPALQYNITAISDPNGCNTTAATGLTRYGPGTASAGFVSVYRRPLPATNLNVLSTILVDGREPSLAQQAIDANRIHTQTTTPLTPAQLTQIVNFETGLYAAQSYSFLVGDLTSHGASGGPVAFAQQPPFVLGMNDPFSTSPAANPFNPDVFTQYSDWLDYDSGDDYGWTGLARATIARGQAIFNERQFTISGVTGLNDVLGQPSITGTCSTCHNTPGAGSHSLTRMMDTGTNAPTAAGLDTSGLPVFTLQCSTGTLPASAGNTSAISVTDPGRAILSGQCADIGRVKVLTLRNLAARPPYFHNGSAGTLGNVVDFYNNRFNIGISLWDKAALVAFLASL